MNNTHTFNLLCGVEAEVKEMTGKHQRILTEQKNKNMSTNLNEMLSDLLVRVGDHRNPSVDFVKRMLSGDRRKALVEARQFTMDFEPVFEFNYEYSDSSQVKQQHPLQIDLSKGFPETPYKVPDDEGDFVPADYNDYNDIQHEIELELPRSGKRIKFTLLSGKGEDAATKIAKKDRSSHSAIRIRFPQEYIEKNDGGLWTELNLDSLPLKDIEHLRGMIKKYEGNIDTEIMFDHPDAENKAPNERDVVVDLLQTVAFFFPSEAI